jgi:hypothetical protein
MRLGNRSCPADKLFDWHAVHEFGQAGTATSIAGFAVATAAWAASFVFYEFGSDST